MKVIRLFCSLLADLSASSSIQYAMIVVTVAGSIIVAGKVTGTPVVNVSVLNMLTSVATALQ
jgi:Flp pilus assembly pilin Flp